MFSDPIELLNPIVKPVNKASRKPIDKSDTTTAAIEDVAKYFSRTNNGLPDNKESVIDAQYFINKKNIQTEG